MKFLLIAFQLLLAASVIVIPLLAIFLPPGEASLCPKCRDDGLVSLRDGRVGKRCPACGYEAVEPDDEDDDGV